MMNEQKNTRRKRRPSEELDSLVMQSLERMICTYGFKDIPFNVFLKDADIASQVFYRRFGTIENVITTIVRKYDFWFTQTINIAKLPNLGHKQFYSEALKTIYKELCKNKVMQKLFLWELSQCNETTRHTSSMRETMNINTLLLYKEVFSGSRVDIVPITAIILGGLFYLVLRKEQSPFCNIQINTPQGDKMVYAAIDNLTDILFDAKEWDDNRRKSIHKMQIDRISQDKICEYLDIPLAEYERLSE